MKVVSVVLAVTLSLGWGRSAAAVEIQPSPSNADAMAVAKPIVQAITGEVARVTGSQPFTAAAFADLGLAGGRALVVKVQSGLTCGTRGCLTVIYRNDKTTWRPVLRTQANTLEAVDPPQGAVKDLVINRVDRLRWKGDSVGYLSTGAR